MSLANGRYAGCMGVVSELRTQSRRWLERADLLDAPTTHHDAVTFSWHAAFVEERLDELDRLARVGDFSATAAALQEAVYVRAAKDFPEWPVRLDDRVSDLVREAGDVTESGDPPPTIEYARQGVVFAARPDRRVIELRLMPDIAEAARRTPSAGPSARGEEWIRFAPPEWDQHATDRLEAWFRVAWRLAGEAGA